jgi:hypothetical protein
VQLATDPQQQQLLTSQHIQDTAGLAQSAPAADVSSAAGFTTPTRKTPASKGKTPASSSSKKAKSSSNAGKQQEPQQGAQQDSKQGPIVSPAAQWQLQLLQAGLDLTKPRQQQLLQRLVHKQLLGQVLLPGNVVYVPLLGAQVLGVLHSITDAAQQQQQQQGQQQGTVLAVGGQQCLTLTHPLLQVTSSTQVQLLMPKEQQSGLQALQALFGQTPTQADAAAAAAEAAAGAGSVSSSDQGAALQQCISLAREAAAAAVDSSAQEAAMEAAERAVRAGMCATLTARVPAFVEKCRSKAPSVFSSQNDALHIVGNNGMAAHQLLLVS